MSTTKTYLKNLIYKVNGSAIEVHTALGPGLLESVYHKCLCHEFNNRGINYKSQLLVPEVYKGLKLDTELRCDFYIEDVLPLEIKAVEYVLPVHEAQIMTYMKLLKAPEGLLINFNVTHIFKEGQKTYVNELFINLPE